MSHTSHASLSFETLFSFLLRAFICKKNVILLFDLLTFNLAAVALYRWLNDRRGCAFSTPEKLTSFNISGSHIHWIWYCRRSLKQNIFHSCFYRLLFGRAFFFLSLEPWTMQIYNRYYTGRVILTTVELYKYSIKHCRTTLGKNTGDIL